MMIDLLEGVDWVKLEMKRDRYHSAAVAVEFLLAKEIRKGRTCSFIF